MSTISAGTTTPTALSLSGDTTGALTFQVNGTTTAATLSAAGNFSLATGNLTFSSTAQRITGDMSNATIANRLMFQTSTANSGSTVQVIPSGTGNTGAWEANNASDPTNSGGIRILSTTSDSRVDANIRGTGTYLPMTFYTGGSERMRLDTSGNVGIGTTTAAAGGLLTLNRAPAAAFGTPMLQVGGASFTSGGYYSIGLGFTDATYTEPPSEIAFVTTSDSGGTLGAITFGTRSVTTNTAVTERMRIDSSGNVGIGTASPLNFGGANLQVQNSSIGSVVWSNGTYVGQLLASAAAEVSIGSRSNHPLRLGTNDTERMRISAAGYVAIGRTTTDTVRLFVQGSTTGSSDFALSLWNSAEAQLMYVRNDGLITTGAAASSPYNNTTGSAANMYVDSSGLLYRSTSSLRYKTNVVDAAHGLADVLKLRSVTYKGKNDGDKVFGGLIAEEVHDAGLTEFVAYDKEGRPDALHYGNMVALAFKAIQELKAENDALKARIEALETK